MGKKTAKPPSRSLPSEQEVLEFVRESKNKVGKREIARAFGIRGDERVELKKILRQLKKRGEVSTRGQAVHNAHALPQNSPLEITHLTADGDLVAIPVDWDRDQGSDPPQVLIRAFRARGEKARGLAAAPGERVLARVSPYDDPPYSYEGRVLRKLIGEDNEVLGLYREGPGQSGRIIPVDKKSRKEFIVRPGDANGAKPGELVAASIAGETDRSGQSARVRKRLGDLNDPRNISLIAVHEHAIPTVFPPAAVRETEQLNDFHPGRREDLRRVPLVTIDPSDARDHDDAVWAEADRDPANPGGFTVIVAIADVAAYVRPGTALDREARLRGNSVYFPDRVIPMLPERISNELCSLLEKQDRPGLACFMTFDRAGNKKRHRFSRVIMRSAAKLNYDQAQAAIDGYPDGKTGALLEPVLKPLWQAYRALSLARAKRAPLELDLPERKIILDAVGLVERIFTPQRLDSHKLIEEFMIQANVSAAETLEEKHTPFIYRVHDTPAPEKVRALSQFLRTLSLSFPLGQSLKAKSFNNILAQVRHKEYEQLVNDVVLRSQAQAQYSVENRGHFGLNLRRYAHFTSPIRRYADLIVHRALIGTLSLGEDGLDDRDIAQMTDTAELISDTERRAMAAERATVDRLVASHLADHVGARFDARISGVVGAGLFVTLLESGADGFVPVTTLGREYFTYHEQAHALVGERTGETYRLGDRVEIEIKEVTPVAGGIRCTVVSGGRPGKPLSRHQVRSSRHRAKARSSARR